MIRQIIKIAKENRIKELNGFYHLDSNRTVFSKIMDLIHISKEQYN